MARSLSDGDWWATWNKDDNRVTVTYSVEEGKIRYPAPIIKKWNGKEHHNFMKWVSEQPECGFCRLWRMDEEEQ